jgi:hypothetical protein
MITGIAHVNLTVPAETLAQAEEFYGGTLQLQSTPVPELQRGTLAWYVILCLAAPKPIKSPVMDGWMMQCSAV